MKPNDHGLKRSRHVACRILTWGLLSLLLLFPWAGRAAQSGDFTYEVAGSEITITGYTGTGGNLVVPDTIDGVAVTRIGQAAFMGCAGLTSLALPNTVTNIGGWAFMDCRGLTNLTLPNNLTAIWACTFTHCSVLTNLSLPESLQGIEDYAFYECTGLTSLVLPHGVINVGDSAFRGCTGLTNITLSDSLIYLGPHALTDCARLTSLELPRGLMSIPSSLGCRTNPLGDLDIIVTSGWWR